MTIIHIASADGAGKFFYDPAGILRSAHATARRSLATNRAWRSYKQALAQALRYEWYHAKRAKAQAEVEAEDANPIVLPADVVERCSALRLQASCAPFGCTKSYRDLNNEADAIEAAALAANEGPSARSGKVVAIKDWISKQPEIRLPIDAGVMRWLPSAMDEDDFDALAAEAAQIEIFPPSADEAPTLRQAAEFLFNRTCRIQNAIPATLEDSDAMRMLYEVLSFLETHWPSHGGDDGADENNETDPPHLRREPYGLRRD